MDAEAFHFLRPLWLLGVPVALAAGWYWRQRAERHSGWAARVDSALLAVLMEGAESRAAGRVTPILGTIAMIIACLGLAGPTWERLPQNVERNQDAMVIVLDLSLSMYAEDLAPSRLDRAKHKVRDLLALRDEGFTALVAYAGDAHVAAPLTDDTNTIENLLAALHPAMMPFPGSNLRDALGKARALFDNAGLDQGRILVLTDGIDALGDATRFRSRQFPVSVLGVGTRAGAPIPLDFINQPGQFLKDQARETIIAQLDEPRLREVAELCYGRYASLTVDDADITALSSTPLPDAADLVEVEREFDAWRDMGFLAALALLPLALLGFRKGVMLSLCLVLVPPPPAHAGLWEDIWRTPDQQGARALMEGHPERAATLFENRDWRAIADYRSGEFDRAAEVFAEHTDATGRYNLGNALARQGELEAAIAAYDAALALAPDHEDAAFNKEIVEDLLNQQQREQAQNEDDASQSQEESESEQGDSEQTEHSQQDSTSQDASDPNASDQEQDAQAGENEAPADASAQAGAEEAQASRDELEEELEQWLRRVPDDPGGLLRRKFKHETDQRVRNGEYRTRDGDKIW